MVKMLREQNIVKGNSKNNFYDKTTLLNEGLLR